MRSSTGAATSAIGSGRCSASRLGASSPSTRVKNEIAPVTTISAIVDAQPVETLWAISVDFRASARVAAPNAPESRVATVTPIWTEDRNRLGSCASFAARWPRLPRCRIERTCPSRSETRAISAPAKNPPTSTMASTTTMSQPTWFTA